VGKVVVRSEDGLRQAIEVDQHHLVGDEPEGAGGHDDGPDPYEYLLIALGTCTSMTLRLYATRKGWPLEGVTVELSHNKVHAQDCAECEGKTGLVDRIERRIHLRGDLDAEQVARLAEIATKCPVHKTLHAGVVVADRVGVE
jgi:putative redox protein